MGLNRDEVSRHKQVVVRREGDHIHEEQIVQDANLENRQLVYKLTQLVWLFFGFLEALIGFRIILKLIAANPSNWFTAFVYQLSDIFLWPFQNILVNPSFQSFVLEISSFIAMLVYAFVGWAIVRLIWLLFYRRATSRVTTYDRDEFK
jgi:uncharacterized protein YggT (Ycf19 family)